MRGRFASRLASFFSGRYCQMDTINKVLMAIWFVLALVNAFVGNFVLVLISYIPPVLIVLRFLSRKIARRSTENQKFCIFFGKIGNFFRFQFKKIKEIGTHRYIKCSHCKATLRVPRKTGKHSLTCPKCHEKFDVHIWF